MGHSNGLLEGVNRRRSLVLVISCLLLTVVFMAVPRASDQGAAYFAKPVSYNHGAGRDPHLGQKARNGHSGSQSNSRKLAHATDFDSVEDRHPGELDNV